MGETCEKKRLNSHAFNLADQCPMARSIRHDYLYIVIVFAILSTLLYVISNYFIRYLSYLLHCCSLPNKRCLIRGMCLYQVMMTLYFLNDVVNYAESIQT